MTTTPQARVSDERLAYLIEAHADKDNWGYSEETATALCELQALRAERRWVPVSEQLPPENRMLLFSKNRFQRIGYRDNLYRNANSGSLYMDGDPDHWRELPPPPQGDGRE